MNCVNAVVDTNIVFSSLIPSNSIIRDNLLNDFNVFFLQIT